MSAFAWDVFVSHNRVNKPWVRQFVKQWRDLGVRVFFDEDSIDPGEDVVSGVERGLAGSRHVVLFLSPASIASRWVALEASISIYADPDAVERRLIPVVLEPVDSKLLRPSVARLNRIDLTDSFSRQERYKYLCGFLGISPNPSLPSNANELRVSISSLATADPLALKTTLYAARALADIGPMMKASGPHEDLDPGIRLERLAGASVHIIVFPERPSRASDGAVEQATAEYAQTKCNNVEVLAYAPADYRMISGLPLRRLYDDVRNCQSITNIEPRYKHWQEEFGRQIARDLDRVAQSNLNSDTIESIAPLAAQHERVLENLYKASLDTANELNQNILTTYSESPRAHYNQACIYSWCAERDGQAGEEYLFRAKRHFERAIELGIVCLISLRSETSVAPSKVIAGNPALQSLFGHYPDLLKTVDDNNFFGPKRLGGGCVEASVAISLADGRNLPSLRLKVGDRVASWNSLTGVITESSVCRRARDIASELLVINGSLRVTPTHPVLVRDEWKSAADIKLGDLLQVASGEAETVVSVEKLYGRFAVLDFNVEPYPTFIAARFIVHNK
jgi:hypothetical protein